MSGVMPLKLSRLEQQVEGVENRLADLCDRVSELVEVVRGGCVAWSCW